MEEESKAEASEDARKRASSIKVKIGDFENPQTSRIAAVSASKCYIAASLVAEHMWVSVIFGRVRSTEATHVRAKKGKKVSANAVGGASKSRET